MGITAKELAKILNISQTAVSMALHNKPGVSQKTKQEVLMAAEKYGYDFSKLTNINQTKGNIIFVDYRINYVLKSNRALFFELIEGVKQGCEENGYPMFTYQIYEEETDVDIHFQNLRGKDCIGIILLGTEISESVLKRFLTLRIPIVLIDAYLPSVPCNSVVINNEQGAYEATEYLIKCCNKKPGYLKSKYRLSNLNEREVGFKYVLRQHALSDSQYICHELSADIEGAFSDMLEIIERNDQLADCYFAENDHIAIGVIKALKLKGYRIPEDIAVIGFDNILEGKIIEPSLTTINVPRHFMGKMAVKTLLDSMNSADPYKIKVSVNPNLVKRFSLVQK